MKSLSVELGVILIGFAIFGYAEVRGADWKLYDSCERYLCYYDTQNITQPSKNIVRVWEKWDYTEKGVIDFMSHMEKFGSKYRNLSYLKFLEEINCLEGTYRSLSLTYYDNKGDVISAFSNSSEWDFIIPKSMNESLCKKVCK